MIKLAKSIVEIVQTFEYKGFAVDIAAYYSEDFSEFEDFIDESVFSGGIVLTSMVYCSDGTVLFSDRDYATSPSYYKKNRWYSRKSYLSLSQCYEWRLEKIRARTKERINSYQAAMDIFQ